MVRTLFGGRIVVRRETGFLALGDAAAIGLFVAAGELQHAGTVAAGVETFVQFALGWAVAATLVGAYGGDALGAPAKAGVLALAGWVPGALLGHVVRSVADPGPIAPAFVLVSLAVGGVLLVAWRAGLAWREWNRGG